MNNAVDDVNEELYSVQKGERCVRIGFEDNAGGHHFRFFNLNLLRCRHLLNNSVLLLSVVLGSAVRIANSCARQRLQWSFPYLYDGARQTDFQWMEGVNLASLHSHTNLESSVPLHFDRFLKECV